MTQIIFLEPVWHYDSYQDFFRLARLAGFPVRRADTLDVSEPGVYITAPMNGDWREMIEAQAERPRNAHLVTWNIERPSGSAGSIGKYAESNRRLLYGQREDGSPAPCRYVDEVWVSDRRLADETTMRYVPLGSRLDFAEPGEEKRWDFVHISYEIPRRQTIYNAFDPNKVAPNGWGEDRDRSLKGARFGVAVHQDNHPFLEPLRLAIFAAYALPTLCEVVADAWPYGDDCMVFSGFDQFAQNLRRMVHGDYARWREMGEKFRQRACVEYEFGKVVRQAVAESVGEWR